MTIPKKVLEQGRMADEEIERLKQEAEGSGSDNDPNTDPPKTEQDPPPQQKAPDEGTPERDGDEGEPGEKPGTEIDWKAEAEAQSEEADRFKRKYEVLKGKYDKEVPDLYARLERLEARSQGHQPDNPQDQGKGADPNTQGLDPQNIEEVRDMYGDGVVNLVLSAKAAAKAEAMEEVNKKLGRIDDLEKATIEQREDRLHQQIAEAHDDWQQIDRLATFRKFLDEVDPNTGLPRGVAVHAAYRRFDPGPIIRAFTDFKRRANTKGHALEAQVVPGDSGRTQQKPQGDEKKYKRADVAAWYTSAAHKLGKGQMKQEEYDRQDALFQKAEREGRIV